MTGAPNIIKSPDFSQSGLFCAAAQRLPVVPVPEADQRGGQEANSASLREEQRGAAIHDAGGFLRGLLAGKEAVGFLQNDR